MPESRKRVRKTSNKATSGRSKKKRVRSSSSKEEQSVPAAAPAVAATAPGVVGPMRRAARRVVVAELSELDEIKPAGSEDELPWPIRLITFEALPDWLKDNEYIRTAYRPPLKSYKACVESLCYVHNETCNIYSHILGVVVILGFTLYGVLDGFLISGSWLQTFSIFMFVLGSTAGMTFSFIFHLCFVRDPPTHILLARLDYAGIAIMIAGSFVPSVYHAFFCAPYIQLLYIVGITVLGIACAAISLLERFATPEYRVHRMSLFLVMGLSGLVPGVHTVARHGVDLVFKSHAVFFHLLMGALYVFGAVLYGLRIPERLSPGTFDIVGQSHSIFHVCVVAAACAHYYAILTMKDYFREITCSADGFPMLP